jgi:hypothetical protein
MLTALAGALGGAVVKQLAGTLIDKVSGAFAAYQQRQITREQLQAELQKALAWPAPNLIVTRQARLGGSAD